ncbi:restriction endonuclease subunit S [Vibrio cholerae]|uniref:restriction endonuclease subunit S n=1 Tax=Vibrio cholerae TaxID=666 RepID=UPI0028B4829F|nr:hypothetical protein [Vibrio cholerae]ELJ8442819.1 restriction endonuclease subunit S [Vibrio cholerae]ELJ8517174.1 restriction endonuclease subunit S [Vibrio cholerae]HDZ3695551.1 restriction endonuclease subunit S [Vibrio cholerae]
MSQLPKGWVCTSISQCFELKNGYAFKSSDYTEDGDFVIRIGNVQDGHIILSNPAYVAAEKLGADSFKLNEGDILISLTGNVGRIGMVSKEHLPAVLNQRVAKICVVNSVEIRWLFYLLRTRLFQQHVLSLAKGAAQLNISTKDIQSFDFALPPLAEQTRIVEKLDEVLAQVDTIKARLDGIPAILKRFRQSVLAAAVSGKLTEEWRGNAEYSDSKNQLVPSTWEVRAAKDICVKVQSGSTPRNDPFNQNGTIPFLKVYNIVNQKIDFDYKPQFITSDTHSETLKRSVAYPGDVLMNIVGPPLGKVAILTEQYPEWNLNQAITLFRANEEILLNKYLYFVLCEGELVRAVMPETKGSVGQVNISLSQCRDSLIPLPPLEEQKEIVRLVDQYFAFADTIEAQVKKAQARVDKLTQSILAKAFRGELVPQDPNDEPADKLLERIATARKEAEVLAKAAKKAAKK